MPDAHERCQPVNVRTGQAFPGRGIPTANLFPPDESDGVSGGIPES